MIRYKAQRGASTGSMVVAVLVVVLLNMAFWLGLIAAAAFVVKAIVT